MDITPELLDDLQRKAKHVSSMEHVADRPALKSIGDAVRYGEYLGAASPAVVDALVEHIRSLTERLERAERDAGRYQHLKDQGHFRAMSIDMGGNHSWTGMGRHIGKGPTIEEAIDAAIAQEGAENE